VIRRWPLPLLVAVLSGTGILASGCGESEKDKYIDDFKPLNGRLLKLGESIGSAPLETGSDGNARLARRFGQYATDLGDVSSDIASLDTPRELEAESKALTRRIEVVVKDLRKISAAAKRGDQRAAAAATAALTDDANDVNRAQNRLATATGADVGPR